MELVPQHYVDLVLGEGWPNEPQYKGLTNKGVRVGSRVEIDVSGAGTPIREKVLGYLDRCRTVARQMRRGGDVGEWIITQRRLIDVVQQGGSKATKRADLASELEALRGFYETAEVAEALCASEIDEKALERDGVTITKREGTLTIVTVRVEGARDWPGVLGGTSGENEIERVFTLFANHASWRDRQARRLARLQVDAVELLAAP